MNFVMTDHFVVRCLVAWPLNESEAGDDLVLKPPCFSYANDAALMLISRNLHKKSSELSIKTRSTPASLSFKGQATKHTTLKWSIELAVIDTASPFRDILWVTTRLLNWSMTKFKYIPLL